MAPATVLTFNLNEPDFVRLRGLSAAMGIRVKAVPPESFTLPLGGMLGIPTGPINAAPVGESFRDAMLLMCNLNEQQFNQFLQMLRAPGLPRIPLKAVLTPHNASWSAIQLHEELLREHEAMTRKQ